MLSRKFQSGLAAVAIAVALFVAPAQAEMNSMSSGKVEPPSKTAVRRTEPVYKVQAGINGEVFPVLANFASFQQPQDRKTGTVMITIENASDSPLRNRLAVKIAGWSDEEIQMIEMAAGEVHTFVFAPTFLPRLYNNHEIVAATATVTAHDLGGRVVFTQTVPVRLRSAADMYWGPNFKFANLIAGWVLPHDRHVEQILSKAKEYMPGRRLPGYESNKTAAAQERATYAQAKAIYRALQNKGVSYVKSSSTFGSPANYAVSERVRLPYQSLRDASANCIDGAVMFASLFENLDMDPEIVLVPGHAYFAVRVANGLDKRLYIETSLTGRASFETAVRVAQQGMAKWKPSQITRISIAKARQAGIYPMPTPERPARKAVAEKMSPATSGK